MSPTERTTWQKDGTFPDRVSIRTKPDTTSDAAAASSTASPEVPAASTDATQSTAASEAASSVETPGKQEKGAKLKARSAALDTEIADLQRKLALRREILDTLAQTERPQPRASDDGTPGSSPARGAWDGSDPADPKPMADAFETHDAYLDARDAWNERRGARKQMTERSIASQVESVQRLGQSATERMAAYQTAHPDFDASAIDDRLLAIPPASALPRGAEIGPQHALVEEILKSPVTPQLLSHFSTDDGRADWQRLCRMPPADLLRAFGRLEARFEAGASSGAGSSAPLTSQAPSPAHTLGTRPADAGDPVDAAVKRRDFTAYSREANKRALAAMGG